MGKRLTPSTADSALYSSPHTNLPIQKLDFIPAPQTLNKERIRLQSYKYRHNTTADSQLSKADHSHLSTAFKEHSAILTDSRITNSTKTQFIKFHSNIHCLLYRPSLCDSDRTYLAHKTEASTCSEPGYI